jgi:pyridoxal phosphate enzyme (YggS family)
VTLVVVTKTHPVAAIEAAIAAGATELGENRVQEALEKKAELDARGTPVHWHLIGHLQSNKAKLAVQNFDLIHSVDSVGLAQELDRHASKAGKQQRVLLQLNVSGDETKFGTGPAAARELVSGVLDSCPNLQVDGLMTMAPFSENPEDARPHFRALRELSAALRAEFGGLGAHLSIGMTGDFEVAIEEGATLVRVGSAIFGHRD